MTVPDTRIRKRLIAALLILFIVMTGLIVRIAYIQIVRGEWLKKEASVLQNRGQTISAQRGAIYDRNGRELAISMQAATISISPSDIRNSKMSAEDIATGLSQILGITADDIVSKIESDSSYQVIAKKVDEELGEKVSEWVKENNIPGLYVDEDIKRFYPDKNLASHVIGFTGADNQGLDGIEYMMEKYLQGIPGRVISEVDANGREVPFKNEEIIEAQDGLNVILTIDENIQYMAQAAAEKAIADNKVLNGVTIIVSDPMTGDILALVSKPDYDLNDPFAAPPGTDADKWKGNTGEDVKILQETVWNNKAIASTYEPGSTFKAVTAAACLEEGVISPSSMVNDKPMKIGGWDFNCWSPVLHGNETFTKAVYNSCNPVFIKIAQSLGISKFYKYMKAFGFYDITGIGLPGEQTGLIHQKPTEVDMAAASFGQRFTITPIQLITAYTALVNGGKLMKPRLVSGLASYDGNIVKEFKPEVIREVISEKTSDTIRTILEGVVAEGTGRNAYIKGYRVAGKTGTSQTTDENRFIASFSAFAPADNPVICVLVVLDDPKGESHMGGVIAAPVAGELIEQILEYLEVQRKYTKKDEQMMAVTVTIPDLTDKTINEAKNILKPLGLQIQIENKGNKDAVTIKVQSPKPGETVGSKSDIYVYTYTPKEELKVKVPDVSGKTMEEAALALKKAGLNMKIKGIGSAIKQQNAPGAEVNKGTVVEVEFRYFDNVE